MGGEEEKIGRGGVFGQYKSRSSCKVLGPYDNKHKEIIDRSRSTGFFFFFKSAHSILLAYIRTSQITCSSR